MKNILFISTIFLFIIGCNTKNKRTDKTEEIKLEIETDSVNTLKEKEKEIETKSLKDRINKLPMGCLDLPMDSIYRKIQLVKIVERNTEKWIFGLEKTDSLQFERADLIRPICKLNENDSVLSVVFSDQYDYKTAIHIFNFRKLDLEPVSSFILHSIGGDAEDFWTTEYKKMDNWTYEITKIIGRYNDVETKDTTFIDLRKTKNIRINKSTGKIIAKEVKSEHDLIITK